jgi:hypothetical protein
MRFSNNSSQRREHGDAGSGVGHRLVIEHQGGDCEARCSCGGWELGEIPAKLSEFRTVHTRLMVEHRRHVEIALRGEAASA